MTISSQVIEVLNYLCQKFGIAIDWTSDNVMPYLQSLCEKFISWEIGTSTLFLIFGVVFALVGIVLIIIDIRCEWFGIGIIFGGIICATAVGIILCQAYDIITCNTFPEKKLFDYLYGVTQK